MGFALAALGTVALEATACPPTAGSTVAALVVSQPVLDAPGAGSDGFELQVDAAGCVRVRYPAWDVRAGDYLMRLAPAELAELRTSLRRTGVAAFQPERVRAELLQRKVFAPRSGSSVRISDAEAIRLQLTAPGNPGPVVVEWQGLQEHRMTYPDHAGLAALEAAILILREIEADPRLEAVAER